jgi:DNA-binding CsgD family transcriptional regulator
LNVAATVGSCLVFAGRMDEGWSLLEAAAKRARADHLESDAARAYRMIGTSASVLLEYDMAERWLTLGIEFAERHELWNDRHYMAAHFAHVGWATGDWSAAGHVASRALADGRGGMTTRITALHVLGYLALGAGDLGRAVDLLEEARRLGEAMAELQRYSPALWGLAEAALLNGDPAAAAAWCERGRAASAGVNDTAYLFPFLVTGTRAKLGLGDPAGAEAWFDALAPALEARSIPGTLVSIDHARGLIELARGRTGKARVSLESARAGWLSRRRCWEGTWSTLDLATCLSRSNRPTAARRLAEEARELALSMGAAPLVERADTVLRRLGDRTPDGEEWAPLSAREYEVARLIAEGRTNAEIARIIVVAPKTVAAHVEHILTKLNMGRRTEVAAWAMRAERDHASPSNAVATRPQPAHPGHDVREHARLRGLAGSRPVDLT